MTRQGCALAIVRGLGFVESLPNVEALTAWMTAEGGSAKANPLNTTQPASGATDYNTAHVKNYPTWSVGLGATLQTLRNGHYVAILAALQHGTSALNVLSAVQASPWGTSFAPDPATFLAAVERGWGTHAFQLVAGT